MFGLFKKKSKLDVLQEKYEKLMKTSFELSKSNRAKADEKYAEAQEILNEMESLTEN